MALMRHHIKYNNTIKSMFTAIRVLLLGDEENINMAGVLLNLTQKQNKDSGGPSLSNLIYNNLNYSSRG